MVYFVLVVEYGDWFGLGEFVVCCLYLFDWYRWVGIGDDFGYYVVVLVDFGNQVVGFQFMLKVDGGFGLVGWFCLMLVVIG